MYCWVAVPDLKKKKKNCYSRSETTKCNRKFNEIFHDQTITRFNKELSTSNKSHNRIYHIRTHTEITFASNAHETASTSNQNLNSVHWLPRSCSLIRLFCWLIWMSSSKFLIGLHVKYIHIYIFVAKNVDYNKEKIARVHKHYMIVIVMYRRHIKYAEKRNAVQRNQLQLRREKNSSFIGLRWSRIFFYVI